MGSVHVTPRVREDSRVVSGIDIGHEGVLLLEIVLVRVLLGHRFFVVLLIASLGETTACPTGLHFLGFKVSHLSELFGQSIVMVVSLIKWSSVIHALPSLSHHIHVIYSLSSSYYRFALRGGTILSWVVIHQSILFAQCS